MEPTNSIQYSIDGKILEVTKEAAATLSVCVASRILVKPSSNIAAVMFGNQEDTFVQVQFKNGGNYIYEKTSPEVINDLTKGEFESIGKYYISNIKNKFEGRKTENKILVPLQDGIEKENI